MRYITRKHPVDGDYRVKRWFAIRPVVIALQGRWLEFVTVKSVKRVYRKRSGRFSYRWEHQAFIDE